MSDYICHWGIIGAGDVCEKKGGPPLYQLEGNRLVAVTRRNREAGEDYARRHGPCRYLNTVDALLADPEINCIYVASPPDAHTEHVLAAAAAGKDILCEKPMANNARQCLDMVKACAAAGVTLAIAYYRRCYPSIKRALDLLQSGAIGELKTIWLNDQFPISHRLDLVQLFCGDITTIMSQASTDVDLELVATTTSGAEMRTRLGWDEIDRPEQVRLTGTKGAIFIHDLKGGALTLNQTSNRKDEIFDPLPATHWGLVKNFSEHLASGIALACDGETGRKSSVVLDYASNLSITGEPVVIHYDNPPVFDASRGKGYGLLA